MYYKRKKYCKVCVHKIEVDYKKSEILRTNFMNDRGKIKPRRATGSCSSHQRLIAREIKRARFMALLPFVIEKK
jgi:small subunit ribosomal protein S18